MKCQHFAIGTGVVMNKRRYTINQHIYDRTRGYWVAILIDENGLPHRIDNPYYLDWR